LNRAIEIHDSVVERVLLVGRDAILDFSSVYIHQSSGKPLVDSGSEWVQRARISVNDAVITGSLSRIDYDLWRGHIKLDGIILDNEIPIPLNHLGDVELRLESECGVVVITGTGAVLELIGEAKYAGEFESGRGNLG
jgi:hypothetical protein